MDIPRCSDYVLDNHHCYAYSVPRSGYAHNSGIKERFPNSKVFLCAVQDAPFHFASLGILRQCLNFLGS